IKSLRLSVKNYCMTRCEGGELGHAFLPTEFQSPLEIHIDHTRKWNYKLEEPTGHDQFSLLETLVHEIGHTLGFVHTDKENSVMYPSSRSVMFKTTPYDIPPYDISTTQNIY
ncbi:Matrix metalloproteinase 2, partial [Carabus blaptoides fortunei]